MRILVVNAGSSSLKLSVMSQGRQEVGTTVEHWEGEEHLEPLAGFLAQTGEVDAVGHRIVHGGPRLTSPVRIDDDVVGYLESITSLAPLHNPRGVAAIRAVRRVVGDVAEVACFDTSFFNTLPEPARTFALPREWNRRWGLRRFGFHGLSHAYAARRGPQVSGCPVDSRVITCHLGSGSSLAAVVAGRPVDTTMGFTPADGLVMRTRPGSLDPGLMMWLLRTGEVTPEELDTRLEQDSGLKGLSGTSGDLREVLQAAQAGDADARLAYEVFLHRLCRMIGAMTASAGGLDLLVFTGGIGEHSARVRADAGSVLGYLGVEVDESRNADSTDEDRDISPSSAKVRTVVVAAREEVEVAAQTEAVVADRSSR